MQFDSETVVLKEINLRYLKTSVPRGAAIVFADTTAEEMTLRHLVSSCLLIFFVASVVFLGMLLLQLAYHHSEHDLKISVQNGFIAVLFMCITYLMAAELICCLRDFIDAIESLYKVRIVYANPCHRSLCKLFDNVHIAPFLLDRVNSSDHHTALICIEVKSSL